jgi:hypothetical protein
MSERDIAPATLVTPFEVIEAGGRGRGGIYRQTLVTPFEVIEAGGRGRGGIYRQ